MTPNPVRTKNPVLTRLAAPKVSIPHGSDRNQCPTCKGLFKSLSGFDKHRTGSFTTGTRRCRSEAEMEAAGMSKNSKGYWITKPAVSTYERVREAA